MIASSRNAVPLVTLPGGAGYMMRVRRAGAAQSGIALAEIYDADPLS